MCRLVAAGRSDANRVDAFTQIWVAADASASLTIETKFDLWPQTSVEHQEAVVIEPFPTAYFVPSDPKYTHLFLVSSTGHVSVRASGLDRQRMEDVARSLTVDPSGAPGWRVGELPVSFEPFVRGWGSSSAVRTVRWEAGGHVVAQSTVARGIPGLIDTPLYVGDAEFTSVGTTRALGGSDASRAVVTWTTPADLGFQVGVRGSLAEAR